jgi:hypothetical protein
LEWHGVRALALSKSPGGFTKKAKPLVLARCPKPEIEIATEKLRIPRVWSVVYKRTKNGGLA